MVLISTRTWEPLYGVDVLIEGFIQAVRKLPELKLLLLNGGSLESELRESLDEAGMADKAHIPGWVSENQLPEYYRAADLYVSASTSDGSSVSLLEALACGLPAIVSDIPGNREWISPDENGWLFPAGDAGALAGRIVEATQVKNRASLAANARAIVEQRADWSINSLKLTEAYEMALETERAP